MEKTCKDRVGESEIIQKRFKRIEGQIRGLMRMVEEEKSCEEILIQIGAAKAALHKVGQIILEEHLHHCMRAAAQKGDEDDMIETLSSALEQFSRLI